MANVALFDEGLKLPFVAALVTTTACAFVLLQLRDWRGSPQIQASVLRNRASISLLVHLISGALGALNMYIVQALFNYTTRMRLREKGASLANVSFWNSLSTKSPNLGISWRYNVPIVVFTVFSAVPAAIWDAAITPTLSATNSTTLIPVPRYSSNSRGIWDSEFELRGDQVWNLVSNCARLQNQLGLITSCPVPDLQGYILTSAASSTSPTAFPQNHSKIDSSGFSYQGRSFGVGAAVGLDSALSTGRIISYSYVEKGYTSSVSCLKNRSSETYFTLAGQLNENLPVVYMYEGFLPNSIYTEPESYPISSWESGSEGLLEWAGYHNTETTSNWLSVAAGPGRYEAFNATQCSVNFAPTEFIINVNMTGRMITVHNKSEVPDFEPSGSLSASVIRSINLLSRMSSTLYVAVLGDALLSNLENTRLASPSSEDDSAILSSTTDFFSSIIDNILLAYGRSQLFLAQDFDEVSVEVSSVVIRIGQNIYIFLIVAVNMLLLGLSVIEAARTHRWRKLPTFDYLNVIDVIASATPEQSKWWKLALLEQESGALLGAHWNEGPAKVNLQAIYIQLQSESEGSGSVTPTDESLAMEDIVEVGNRHREAETAYPTHG